MKKKRLFLNVIIALAAALTAFLSYKVITDDLLPLKNGINVVFSALILLTLLSHRFILAVKEQAGVLNVILIILIVANISYMYLERSMVSSLWNWTISLIVIQQSRLLFALIRDNNATSIITKWLIVLSTFFLLAVLIFKLGSSGLFMAGLYGFALLSIVILISSFLNQKTT